MIRHYDVVLLPNDALANKAIEASQRLEPLGGIFVLKPGTFEPHISLYMLGLNDAALETVASSLVRLASKLRPMKLAPTRHYQKHGYVDVEFTKSPELKKTQELTLSAIAPQRTASHHDFKDPNPIIQANVDRFGYKSVGELFRPHITFTRFDTEVDQDLSSLPLATDFEGTATKLGLFQLGPNGTCVKEIEVVTL